MSNTRWDRVKDLFGEALETPEDQRAQCVRQECGGDSELLLEVESLLRLHQATDRALDRAPLTPLREWMGQGERRVGEVLSGRYQVVRKVASGGMGDVYEATDLETGARVALKFVRPTLADSPVAEARFAREVKLAQTIAHPNVCSTLSLEIHDIQRYSVMEFLEGETLADRLAAKGAVTPAEALPIVCQMCDGLAAAHAAGVVHRDFKPSNVFLIGQRAVIIDFGLAVSVGRASTLTEEGALIGTLAYMAPEQFDEGGGSTASDIYSLGVVMHEMLVGQKPHTATSPFRLAAQKAKDSRQTPHLAAAGVPWVWEDVIARCLRARPKERFEAVEQVKAALERGHPSARFFVARPWVKWPAAGLVTALVGWAAWSVWTREYRPNAEASRLFAEGQAAMTEAAPWRGTRLLEKAVALDPEFVEARAMLATGYAEVDQPDQARDAMLQATAVADRRWVMGRGEKAALDAARAALIQDYDGAVKQYQRLATLTMGRERSYARLAAARMQLQAGKTDAGRAALEKVAREDPGNMAARIRLALLLSGKRQYERAATEFAAAEKVYRASVNLEGLCDLLLARTAAHFQTAAEDRRDLEQVMELSARTGSHYHALSAKFQLAAVAQREARYDDAITVAREASEQARREGMPNVAARALRELGYTFVFLKKLEQAIPILWESVQMAERTRSYATLAGSQMKLGEVLGMVGRGEEGVAVMEPAVRWYRRSGAEATMPLVLIKWGSALGGGPRWSEAEGVFREALELSERSGNEMYQSMALQRLGSLQSVRNLRQSVEFWEKTVVLGRKVRLTGAFFQAASALGHFGNFARADEFFNEGDAAVRALPTGLDRIHFEEYGRVARAVSAVQRGRCREAEQLIDAVPLANRTWDLQRHQIAECRAGAGVLRQNLRWLEAALEGRPAVDALGRSQFALAAAQTALLLNDYPAAKRFAQAARRSAEPLDLRSMELESALILRAAGDATAEARALRLSKELGFDPPEKFGGRWDLRRLWERRR